MAMVCVPSCLSGLPGTHQLTRAEQRLLGVPSLLQLVLSPQQVPF